MFFYELSDQCFENMLNHVEIIYAYKVEHICKVLGRLMLAEIEVLYRDGFHAWIKDNL